MWPWYLERMIRMIIILHTKHEVYNRLIVLVLDYEWTFYLHLWFYAIGSAVGILNIDAWIPLRICLILHLKRLIASDKKTSKSDIKYAVKADRYASKCNDNTNTVESLHFEILLCFHLPCVDQCGVFNNIMTLNLIFFCKIWISPSSNFT